MLYVVLIPTFIFLHDNTRSLSSRNVNNQQHYSTFKKTYISCRLGPASDSIKTRHYPKPEQQEEAGGAGAATPGASSQAEAAPGKGSTQPSPSY